VITGLTPGSVVYVIVSSVNTSGEGSPSAEESVPVPVTNASRYFPPWAGASPVNTFRFDYDGGKSSSQNGADLAAAIKALQPGDRLEVGTGTWSVDAYFNLNLQGTAANPIWVVAQSGAVPVITRPDQNQNTLNLGSGGLCEYFCLRGIEITGGDYGLRLYNCRNVWIDQCEVHHTGAGAITANTVPTESLYLTRNEVHDTGGLGEGFYIGGNYGNPVARYCVIALNHVYNTGGSQGDGIELKQGSYGNWIAENTVHDTNYPCILVYGTGGLTPFNIVERNLCWNSNDNVMQVQGEAVVRNNILIAGSLGFASHDHQGATRDLIFVHNTVLNGGTAASMSSWDGRAGMVFANNAVYSQSGDSIQFSGGSQGVVVTGNVVVGPVSGAASGYVTGAGLSDFVNAAYDASSRDVTPSATSALTGAGDPAHAEVEDFFGTIRTAPVTAGAVDDP